MLALGIGLNALDRHDAGRPRRRFARRLTLRWRRTPRERPRSGTPDAPNA
jgi:hypothetical protein